MPGGKTVPIARRNRFDRNSLPRRKLMPGEEVRILTVARLVPIKGISCAIEAIAQLRERGMAVRYDVVGDGQSDPILSNTFADSTWSA